MAKTRSGSIRKLPSGRWQARFRTVDGRRVTAPVTFPTKTDARLWLASAMTDEAIGARIDPNAGNVLLERYAWEWLRGRVGLALRTREVYSLQLRTHILPLIDPSVPALGAIPVSKITPALVRRWYAALERERSHSVAAKAYVRLKQVLRHAVDEDLLFKNPCRIERGGVEQVKEQRFATLPELYRLAEAVPDRYRAMVLTAGFAGLRQGELFGLRRSDVDLETAAITVRRKRLRLASGQVIEDAPKTAAGLRSVALPDLLADELRQHLGRYVADGPDAYVFTSATGQTMEKDNFRSRVWLPAVESVGMAGFRFHDLRHTAGTLAAQTGASTRELMARLGHASIRASLIYQHAASDRDRVIAERLDEMAREAGMATTWHSRPPP